MESSRHINIDPAQILLYVLSGLKEYVIVYHLNTKAALHVIIVGSRACHRHLAMSKGRGECSTADGNPSADVTESDTIKHSRTEPSFYERDTRCPSHCRSATSYQPFRSTKHGVKLGVK